MMLLGTIAKFTATVAKVLASMTDRPPLLSNSLKLLLMCKLECPPWRSRSPQATGASQWKAKYRLSRSGKEIGKRPLMHRIVIDLKDLAGWLRSLQVSELQWSLIAGIVCCTAILLSSVTLPSNLCWPDQQHPGALCSVGPLAGAEWIICCCSYQAHQMHFFCR